MGGTLHPGPAARDQDRRGQEPRRRRAPVRRPRPRCRREGALHPGPQRPLRLLPRHPGARCPARRRPGLSGQPGTDDRGRADRRDRGSGQGRGRQRRSRADQEAPARHWARPQPAAAPTSTTSASCRCSNTRSSRPGQSRAGPHRPRHYRGLEQALEERANKVFDQLSHEAAGCGQEPVRQPRHPGEGREDTRARITLATDQRPGRCGRSLRRQRCPPRRHRRRCRRPRGRGQPRGTDPPLGRLRAWIDENRANLRTRADLVADRADGSSTASDADLLIPPGLRLEAARKLRDEPGDVRIDDILDYIQASIDADIAAHNAVEAARAAQHQRELEAAQPARRPAAPSCRCSTAASES